MLTQVDPGARDEVSLDAARALGLKAQGDAGSFADALDAGIDEVGRMIEDLRAGFDAYRQSDSNAGRELRSTP
ncbi:hypothetical protein Acsp06_21040 [Actinomycetospora sp. NBRC 106375]|nr:hypothetical protein Acsp06_21040 [Actinomycetospora sp. NBRC 106375]